MPQQLIRVKKKIANMKKYARLEVVTATKQRASAQAAGRMRPKVGAERPPSCHARTAANIRNTETRVRPQQSGPNKSG
jgi:hypothetical protein